MPLTSRNRTNNEQVWLKMGLVIYSQRMQMPEVERHVRMAYKKFQHKRQVIYAEKNISLI